MTQDKRATIRPLNRRDLPVLASLMQELSEAAHTDVPFAVERLTPLFEAMAADPDAYMNLIAEVQGCAAGFVSVVFYRSFFHRVGTALINELIVSRMHRREGIGSLLINAVKEEALRRGMDEIEVGTENGNAAARSFYKDNGFDQEFVLLGVDLPQG